MSPPGLREVGVLTLVRLPLHHREVVVVREQGVWALNEVSGPDAGNPDAAGTGPPPLTTAHEPPSSLGRGSEVENEVSSRP
jgi:hypothetical protein